MIQGFLYRAAVLALLSSMTVTHAELSVECKDQEYRASLNKLSKDVSSQNHKISSLSSFTLSISGEIGRYEQVGKQQSHRYALALGSINGRLAVLDDPKRAESYLKDSVQRATVASASTKNRLLSSKKSLEEAEMQAASQRETRGDVSSEMQSLVETRTERAHEAQQEQEQAEVDLTNWEAALTSFSEGCSDDTSLNDCVSEMMRELPGGAGALVQAVSKMHKSRDDVHAEMRVHRQHLEACLGNLTEISTAATEMRITFEAKEGAAVDLSQVEEKMAAQQAVALNNTLNGEEAAVASIFEKHGAQDMVGLGEDANVGEHAMGNVVAGIVQADVVLGALSTATGAATGGAASAATGAAMGDATGVAAAIGSATGSEILKGVTGAQQTERLADEAEVEKKTSEEIAEEIADDSQSDDDTVALEAIKEAEAIDHEEQDDQVEQELETYSGNLSSSLDGAAAVAAANALKNEAQKEASNAEDAAKTVRDHAKKSVLAYVNHMEETQADADRQHAAATSKQEKETARLVQEEKQLSDRIEQQKQVEARLREESTAMVAQARHTAVAQAIAITNAAKATANRIRTDATESAAHTISVAQMQAKDLQFKLQKTIETFQSVDTVTERMAEQSRDDAIRHRAAVRERESRAAARLLQAANAVTEAERTAASIVTDARSSARKDSEDDVQRRVEYLSIARNNIRDAFMPTFTKYVEAVVSDVEEAVINAQVNISSACQKIGRDRAIATAGVESANRGVASAEAFEQVSKREMVSSERRAETIATLVSDLTQEVATVSASPVNVSLTSDDSREVVALQENNDRLEALNSELVDVQTRYALARLTRSKRRAAHASSLQRQSIARRMRDELAGALDRVHAHTEEIYYHEAHVVSDAFVVSRTDVERLKVASSSYVSRLESLRNATEYLMLEAGKRVERNQEHVRSSVERVEIAVEAAREHARQSLRLEHIVEEESDDDRQRETEDRADYDKKRLSIQKTLTEILASITFDGKEPEEESPTTAGADEDGATGAAIGAAIGSATGAANGAGAADIQEAEENVNNTTNFTAETAFERQARITLDNYRNAMATRIAADLDVLSSANRSIALIDQSIDQVHKKVEELNERIRNALDRVDKTMRVKIEHVQDKFHLQLLGRERHNELELRAHADTDIVLALRNLEAAEQSSKDVLSKHTEARHAFAVSTSDVAWVQEHLNVEGSDIEAISAVEKARATLVETKSQLRTVLEHLDAEKERFKAVLETSASTEISAALRTRDEQLHEMVQGEEKRAEVNQDQALSEGSIADLMQYKCRTDSAKSSKAEALLRQSSMFLNQAERAEVNAHDDYDQAMEDVDYVHCSPEVKTAIGLAEEAWHSAQENTIRAQSATQQRELTAREANRLRALTCSKAEVAKISNLDVQASAEEERQVAEGTKALENVELVKDTLPSAETEQNEDTADSTGGATGLSATDGATGPSVVVSFDQSSTGGATGGAATGGAQEQAAEAISEEGVAERAEREADEINAMVDEMKQSETVQATADAQRKTQNVGKTREEEENERRKINDIVQESQAQQGGAKEAEKDAKEARAREDEENEDKALESNVESTVEGQEKVSEMEEVKLYVQLKKATEEAVAAHEALSKSSHIALVHEPFAIPTGHCITCDLHRKASAAAVAAAHASEIASASQQEARAAETRLRVAALQMELSARKAEAKLKEVEVEHVVHVAEEIDATNVVADQTLERKSALSVQIDVASTNVDKAHIKVEETAERLRRAEVEVDAATKTEEEQKHLRRIAEEARRARLVSAREQIQNSRKDKDLAKKEAADDKRDVDVLMEKVDLLKEDTLSANITAEMKFHEATNGAALAEKELHSAMLLLRLADHEHAVATHHLEALGYHSPRSLEGLLNITDGPMSATGPGTIAMETAHSLTGSAEGGMTRSTGATGAYEESMEGDITEAFTGSTGSTGSASMPEVGGLVGNAATGPTFTSTMTSMETSQEIYAQAVKSRERTKRDVDVLSTRLMQAKSVLSAADQRHATAVEDYAVARGVRDAAALRLRQTTMALKNTSHSAWLEHRQNLTDIKKIKRWAAVHQMRASVTLSAAREELVSAEQKLSAARLNVSFVKARVEDLQIQLPFERQRLKNVTIQYNEAKKSFQGVKTSLKHARAIHDEIEAAELAYTSLGDAASAQMDQNFTSINDAADDHLHKLRANVDVAAQLPNKTAFEAMYVEKEGNDTLTRMRVTHAAERNDMQKLVHAITKEKSTWENYVKHLQKSMDIKEEDYKQAIKDANTADNGNNANRSWMAGAKEQALRAADIDQTNLKSMTDLHTNASKTLATLTSKWVSISHKYQLMVEAHEAREGAFIASKRLEYWVGIVGTEEETFTKAQRKYTNSTQRLEKSTAMVSDMETEQSSIVSRLDTAEGLNNKTKEAVDFDASNIHNMLEKNVKITYDALNNLLKESQEAGITNKSSTIYSAAMSWEMAAGNLTGVENSTTATPKDLLNRTTKELLMLTKEARMALSTAEETLSEDQRTIKYTQETVNATLSTMQQLTSLHTTMLATLIQEQKTEIRRLMKVETAKKDVHSHLTSIAHWLQEDSTFATVEAKAQTEMDSAHAQQSNATANLKKAKQELERVQAMSALLSDSENALLSAKKALSIATEHVLFTKEGLRRAMEDGEQTRQDVEVEREAVASSLAGQLTEYELAVKLKKSAKRSATNCTRIAKLKVVQAEALYERAARNMDEANSFYGTTTQDIVQLKQELKLFQSGDVTSADAEAMAEKDFHEVNSLSSRLNNVTAGMESNRQNLVGQYVDGLRQPMKDLVSEITDIDNATSAVRTDLDGTTALNAGLESTEKVLTQNVTSLKKALEEQRRVVEKMETELVKAQDLVNIKSTEGGDLSDSIEASDQLSSVQQQLLEAREKLSSLRDEYDEALLSSDEGSATIYETTKRMRTLSNNIASLQERREDAKKTLMLARMRVSNALTDIDRRMRDEINGKEGVPGDVALQLTTAETLKEFTKSEFAARDLQQEKKEIVRTVSRLGKSIRANALLAGAAASVAARKQALTTIVALVQNSTMEAEAANISMKETRQKQMLTDEESSDLHKEIVTSNGMLSAGKKQADRMQALSTYKSSMGDRERALRSMQLRNEEATDVTHKYKIAWEESVKMSQEARRQVSTANGQSKFAKGLALRFADSKATLHLAQREENRTRLICDRFHDEQNEQRLNKFDKWLSGYKAHVDLPAEAEATRAAGVAHQAVQSTKKARISASSARRREHSLALLLSEAEARSNDARNDAHIACKERDSYHTQLLNIRRHLTDADQWFAGVSTKALEDMAATAKARCTTTTEDADRTAKAYADLSLRHKTAVLDLVKSQAKANAANVASLKAVDLADQYRHHAIRRAKEKTKAWHAAAKEACDEATVAAEVVMVQNNFVIGNHSDFATAANKANDLRRIASKAFGAAVSQHKFAKEMSRLQQIALKNALEGQVEWKRNVTSFVKAKMLLEQARGNELDEKGKLPRSTRLTTSSAVMTKVQNDIARRVRDTSQASNDTIIASDLTRVHSKNTLDSAISMKMALLKARTTERKSGLRAKQMSDTLLKMGAKAMSSAATVAAASDETLGTPEPATRAEESVEEDVTEAAREYGATTNKVAAEEELEEQIEASGETDPEGTLGKVTKVLNMVSDTSVGHGSCVTALGFAWCEETSKCYSVAEPSHCPTTRTRATPGRVLEVADCPWCVPDDGASGKTNPTHPLFQGLLVHYMKEAETENLKWVDATTSLLKDGYAMRNVTNQTIHLLIDDAAVSNREYSSKRAIATLHRQELEHEAVGDVVQDSGEAVARQHLDESTRAADQVTEQAKPSLDEPDAKPAPEVVQEMEEASMKNNEQLMVDAAKNEMSSKEEAIQASTEKEAETEAAHAVDTMEKRGDDVASIESGVERLSAARERLSVASTDSDRQAALDALQKLEDGLVDKTDAAAADGKDASSVAEGNTTTLEGNTTNDELSSEPGATIKHGFDLKGISTEVISSNLPVFQEAVSAAMSEAVSGLDKVLVEKESRESVENDAEDAVGKGESNDVDALVHVAYEVVLKSGVDATSKSVDLVQLDVTVLTSILEAKLQDAGMNVAGIQVIKMDENTEVEGGEELGREADGAATGATGNNGCEGCETKPEVTSKIENLEGTVQDQSEKLTELEKELKTMKQNRVAAASENIDDMTGMTGGATGSGIDMTEPCLHGDCDLLQSLPSPDADNATDLQNAANQELVDALLSGNTTNLTSLQNDAREAALNSSAEDSASVDGDCIPATVVTCDNNTACQIMTITGLKCRGDMSHEQAQEACSLKGKTLCSHAQMESAFQCGFRTNVCAWTKSTVKDGGRIVERVLDKELEICELAKEDKNNQGGGTFGAHCCELEEISTNADAAEKEKENTTPPAASSRRFLRRRRR